MSDTSNVSVALNIYDEHLDEETTLDLSSRGLEILPNIDNNALCVLYLQNNKIKSLPEEFFPSLPHLMWLDLRDNQLTDIPKSIKNHPSLTHLLLANNKISSLPNELGTLRQLKVLQLSGNPLHYPPKEVVSAGTVKLLQFMQEKLIEDLLSQSVVSDSDQCTSSFLESSFSNDADGRSYNSVLDEEKLTKSRTPLSVQFSEKEPEDSDEEYCSKVKGKCLRLPKSRLKTLSPHCQSAKYLKKSYALSKEMQEERIKQSFMRDFALNKQKDLLATRDKILQRKKNSDLLRSWRQSYRGGQARGSGGRGRGAAPACPYGTSPEYMTLLSREDIEGDLPDKYRRRLVRRSKPSVPRRSAGGVQLALKIKQLFEKLEALDLRRDGMTPRTEQRALLDEIQKISEIKQKLMELSTTNSKSVSAD